MTLAGAAEHTRGGQQLDAVEFVHVRAEMRERTQERAMLLARLDQHRVFVGQVTGQLVVIADELAARAVQRTAAVR